MIDVENYGKIFKIFKILNLSTYFYTPMILLDYAYFSRGAKGFRIAITDSRDKPIVEQNGFLVAPGSETLIAMVPTILSTTVEALEFKPEDRNCYTNDEVDLKYFTRLQGFQYSMQNCLYESVLENILDRCRCIPNFMSFKLENITYSVCRGTDLDCALDKIHYNTPSKISHDCHKNQYSWNTKDHLRTVQGCNRNKLSLHIWKGKYKAPLCQVQKLLDKLKNKNNLKNLNTVPTTWMVFVATNSSTE